MTFPDIKRAKQLRKKANFAERKAWETLRELRKYGYPVRRQHPIEGITVDFAIRKIKLAIEIDGGIHDIPSVAATDAERDEKLSQHGWRILRIPAKIAISPDHLMALMQEELGL